MHAERIRELLAKPGAIIEGHFVGTNGNHLSVYVAKDKGTRLTSVASEVCFYLADTFVNDDIDAVVAPAVGGLPLSQWTAYHLSRRRPDRPEVLALYSEHEDIELVNAEKKAVEILLRDMNTARDNIVSLQPGEKIYRRTTRFVLKRGFDIDVNGKRVLEVEDILTTGGSAKKTAEAIERAGGNLVGLGVLANGGNVTATDCGVKRLEALMTVERLIYTEVDCIKGGLCAMGVPINTTFGHGKAFLARTGRTS